MKTINLFFHGKKTNAYYILEAGNTEHGATVTRRKKGFTDYRDIQILVTVGYLEARLTGPRGGIRYFTTTAGNDAMTATKVQSSPSEKAS